jgi:hypothetical protein
VIVFGETRASAATSRTPSLSAALAIRSCAPVIATLYQNSDSIPLSILVLYHCFGTSQREQPHNVHNVGSSRGIRRRLRKPAANIANSTPRSFKPNNCTDCNRRRLSRGGAIRVSASWGSTMLERSFCSDPALTESKSRRNTRTRRRGWPKRSAQASNGIAG